MIAASQIIDQIDIQIHNLMNVRAVFPTLWKGMAGAHQFRTPPFYSSQGYNVTLVFDPPLTEQQIEEINRIGRWANQSFVVWLCALLEFHHVIPVEAQGHFNNKLEGHEEIDILRRLRNELVHQSGKYNSQEPESRKLYERMVHRFLLRTESANTAHEFPVHIDGFLVPLAEGCKRYVQALARQEQ